MATIDQATVEKVARLANLSLTEEEKARFAEDLSQILSAFAVLDGFVVYLSFAVLLMTGCH